MMENTDANRSMEKEAELFLKGVPHPVSILRGTADYTDEVLTDAQKAILIPRLADHASWLVKALEKDEKVSAKDTQRLFAFINQRFTWQERVGFTHILSRSLNTSFTRFSTCDAFIEFGENTQAYLRGSI